MTEDQADKPIKAPLKERIQEKIRGWVDELAEALESILAPEPEPIPIPIRKRY